MKGNYLGEFEELLMLMVAILKDEAYGMNIVTEIENRMDRRVNLSAVHVTLYRLEDKGYVQSLMGGSTSERGGRRKRFFQLTASGMTMLEHSKEKKIDLWKHIPKLSAVNS